MLLTAVDIDNNKITIEKRVDERMAEYVKAQLGKKMREYKRTNEIPEENRAQILKELKDRFKEEILSSPETEYYRNSQYDLAKLKSDNYFVVRETLQDLNELNEFSSEIERNQLQLVDKFKSLEELIRLNFGLTEKFRKYKDIRKTNIKTYIESYNNKKLSFKDNELDLIIKMRELYEITKDYDDIELFDKYGIESNIDMSNKLADIYLHKAANGDYHSNLINDWYRETGNAIQKLSKKVIINNNFLGLLLLTNSGTGRTSFIANNAVTCLKTTYTTTNTNQYTYVLRTLGELLLEITNPELKDIPKEDRQQIYMTYEGSRPKQDMYYKWNGLQVFDIDLKEWDQVNMIEILKRKMFEYLQDFHWFLWICKSASGKGLHIYTKVAPPHHMYTDVKDNDYISKYWHAINYEHKSSIIYDIIRTIHKDKSNQLRFKESDFTDEFEIKFLDNSVSRITSGIRLTYDDKVLINPNFIDLHPSIGLSETIDNKSINDLIFRNTEVNNKLLDKVNTLTIDTVDDLQNKISEEIDLSKYEFAGDMNKIQPLPRNFINYNIRYHVVNTLASMFGKDALPIAHKLLQSEVCKNVREINSFYSCAISNKKQPSKLGLDILKKSGIIKSIKPEIKNVTDNIFKNGIKKAIENSLNNQFLKPTIQLDPTEYLADKMDILLSPSKGGFINEKINILLSPPGSGKTYFLLKLAKEGRRILLVEPFVSVIKNKVESDKDLMEIFQVFYDDVKLDKLEPGKSAVCTFDKFSKCDYNKVSQYFDYICIDESHLLFTSSYRIDTTSQSIRKIKELFYISSNDMYSAKIILMTGTETGDTYFFGDVGNVIRVNKKSLDKKIEFLICDDTLDCITRLSDKAAILLNKGYRLLIPTNKGEIYSQKIIGMIESILQRPVKYGYYKRSNSEQEICTMINKYNTVGDYEIIFCSNYLSVGVDIVDKLKFASLYFGPFSGYEVEQFNARIRKSGIESIYCVQTEKADGTTNDLLIEEPNLVLKLTEEDIEHFLDDKQIAKAKQEFIAQYDPVLHKITTPGFSYFGGMIRFNQEEYELVSFENKFLEAMVHPVKVARELSKYGYEITISDCYEGLSLEEQQNLKKIGMESAKNEKIRKHSLLVGTFIELVKLNNFVNDNGVEFNNFIDWLLKHKDVIVEDRNLEQFVKVGDCVFNNPQEVFVKSREAFDDMCGPAKFVCSKYSVTKALDIINKYVDENGILKKKSFQRAIRLMKLIENADSNSLSEPMFKTLEKIYDWLDKFSYNKRYRISYATYQADVDAWTSSYVDMIDAKNITNYGYQKIKDSIIEMLHDVASRNTSKEGIRFDYNKLPDEDGTLVKYKKSVDMMVESMFKLTLETTASNKKARTKHIILSQQPLNNPNPIPLENKEEVKQ